ncbi:hypothetical protein GWI34_06825 [Actinomadura sp. DSM 109109]|nr:hypothetical protein [Actinomadura lepetitiana]
MSNPKRFDNPGVGEETNARVLKHEAQNSPTGSVDVQSGTNGNSRTTTTVSGDQSVGSIQKQVRKARGKK